MKTYEDATVHGRTTGVDGLGGIWEFQVAQRGVLPEAGWQLVAHVHGVWEEAGDAMHDDDAGVTMLPEYLRLVSADWYVTLSDADQQRVVQVAFPERNRLCPLEPALCGA